MVTINEFMPEDEASVTSSLILTPCLLSDFTAGINPIFSMHAEISWVFLLSTI